MTLNILGAKVKIVIKDDFEDSGQAKYKKKELWLCSSLKGEEFLQALHHEIAHWILYRSGQAEGMKAQQQEAIADVIGFVYSENWKALKDFTSRR